MEISVVKNNDQIIIGLNGILNPLSAMELKNILINEFCISDEIPSDIDHMIIDLSSLESTSAAGIGVLTSLQAAFKESKKRLSLVNIPASFGRLLQITNLYGHFSVYGSMEDVENANNQETKSSKTRAA